MESVIIYNHSPLPALLPLTKSKLRILGFSLKDGPLSSTHQSTLQFSASNIRADGHRRARLAINGDDNKTPQSSKHNKEEILALFRRIQSSISSGESDTSKGRTNNASAESVLEVLRQSRKQVKGKALHRGGGGREKEERIDLASKEAKISRPPSNFVKRSPIPSAPVETVQDDEDDEVKSEELESMKLAALKEVAKSRGIKGYSKLKKGELIELLKTL